MKYIELTQGKEAIVDDEDYEYLSQWKWHYARNKYAARVTTRKIKPRKKIYMHRLIMKNPKKKEVDHKNGNGLDNRKANLRICTTTENKWNYKKPKTNTTGYKGVSWHKRDKIFTARIRVNYKLIHLGNFESLIEASKAYDNAAKRYHGKFARINQT